MNFGLHYFFQQPKVALCKDLRSNISIKPNSKIIFLPKTWLPFGDCGVICMVGTKVSLVAPTVPVPFAK
mgnify:CR=1